ncbi:MAG: enoyl-CoA hydratase/isomerase family protein [Thaumarchaeota archaeon]|nr:enoyl-CoA hydratase/isomerase family protein [Nitrososphaerota archaeon]
MKYTDVVVEDADEITVVKLNRPDSLNSLRTRTVIELDDALAGFAGTSRSRAMIITGMGDKAFCAGGDIKEMEKMKPADARSFARSAHRALSKIEATGKPIIAAVNGLALGAGCDLALACDMCTASESARFGMPSLRVGVVTPFGGMSRLKERVGLSRARYLIYTGDLVDAQGAIATGMAQGIFPNEDLLRRTMEVARSILDKAPIAFALSKKLLTDTSPARRKADALEIAYYVDCFRTKDQREAAEAFRMKRKPVFTGC